MNNVANINDVSNSVKATPSILHCGTPVITTGIMAKLYGTDEANVKMNFSRNADRFIEGKHYFKLEGVELKGFKDRVTKSYPVKFHDQIVGKRARSLALWTERGAARHAKMLDTDNAWDVFEALEDFYFAKKQESQHKSTVQERNPLKNAVNLLVSKKGIMYPEAYSLVHQQFNVSGIDELTADQIPMAVEYVHKLVMEGEYIPKQQLPQVGLESLAMPMSFFDEYDWLFDLEGVDKAKSLSEFYRYPQKMLKNMAEYPNPLIEMLTKLRGMGVNIDAAYFWLKALQHRYEVNTSSLNRKERLLSDVLLSNTSVAHNIIKSIIDEWRNILAPAIKKLNPALESEVTKQLSELNGVIYCNLLSLKEKPETKLLD
ncbi:ORF6N domain-containing protein [Providencia rettgeri]|uniref:ORF6N domain-containing protein n=1 Tax=Providencia rettgeri TaxID=587 RepID=UPI001B358311|nr:ORF6N domain-containing protein [Providencia rettgeri]ELR5161877.1 ORF6N domain-containing protein [Providencia rettgeri]MBQ0361262.1 ORF6N domain-containing protein [Providencia rettgeri]MBQ0664863.1 ORF6N domain-containing protein [Providencia rettgeri]MCB4826672.1 ORF6N domain-containing protein [Providencia rettgeri]MCG9945139.1 ORF6N domain-containing protein [Providencia rettgeri]